MYPVLRFNLHYTTRPWWFMFLKYTFTQNLTFFFYFYSLADPILNYFWPANLRKDSFGLLTYCTLASFDWNENPKLWLKSKLEDEIIKKIVLWWGSKWVGFTWTLILFCCYTDWPLVLNRLAAVTVQVVAWWSKPLLLSCPSPSIIVSLVTALLWETACHVASPPGGGLAVARPQSTAHCALSKASYLNVLCKYSMRYYGLLSFIY